MIERILDYSHKARVLRQIQSNKALIYKRLNNVQGALTIIVSSFLTFMGFSGLEKIESYVDLLRETDAATIEFAFNLHVFALMVLVVLHFVAQLSDKQLKAETAVVQLTSIINEIDDLLSKSDRGYLISDGDLQVVRHKYDATIQVIPANTDSDFLKAKKDYQEKARRSKILAAPEDLFDPSKQLLAVESIIIKSSSIMRLLEILREVDTRLYLCGSLVRNIVWDRLHGHVIGTRIDDVDVIYFDELSETKKHDQIIEELLKTKAGNVKWSVKNQFRMSKVNNEDYLSLEDAVEKFPDTASAFAVKLSESNEIELVAPLGFDDLFRMIVAPSPHFLDRISGYEKRVKSKNWIKTWPKLKVYYVSEDEASSAQDDSP